MRNDSEPNQLQVCHETTVSYCQGTRTNVLRERRRKCGDPTTIYHTL